MWVMRNFADSVCVQLQGLLGYSCRPQIPESLQHCATQILETSISTNPYETLLKTWTWTGSDWGQRVRCPGSLQHLAAQLCWAPPPKRPAGGWFEDWSFGFGAWMLAFWALQPRLFSWGFGNPSLGILYGSNWQDFHRN